MGMEHGITARLLSRVYVKKGRHPQKYSIKYDVGGTMSCEEEHIEVVDVESSESDDSETGQRETMERDSDNEEGEEDSDDADEGGRVVEQEMNRRERETRPRNVVGLTQTLQR
jgi:hypothetical protein